MVQMHSPPLQLDAADAQLGLDTVGVNAINGYLEHNASGRLENAITAASRALIHRAHLPIRATVGAFQTLLAEVHSFRQASYVHLTCRQPASVGCKGSQYVMIRVGLKGKTLCKGTSDSNTESDPQGG